MQTGYDVIIEKSKPFGKIVCPPSKSMAHRLLIATYLAGGGTVNNVALSEDISATVDCLTSLGAYISTDKKSTTLKIDKGTKKERVLLARESGSTLRFLIPLCMDGIKTTFIGKGRLIKRPLEIYKNIAKEQNIHFEINGECLTLLGKLHPGVFTMPGDVSSQFITGLLFALPKLCADSKIILTTPLESKSYLYLTIKVLSEFGVKCYFDEEKNTIDVPGNQVFSKKDSFVEADYSNAAFFCALDTMYSTVSVDGIDGDTLQGDRVFKEHFKSLKSGFSEISVKDCPDLAPILMTLAAYYGGAVLNDTKRLRIKESDRGSAMSEELSKFGAKITVEENRILIEKSDLHPPFVKLSSHNDHRIAMSLAVLCTAYGGEIVGANAVEKSLPDFFDMLYTLGVKLKRT